MSNNIKDITISWIYSLITNDINPLNEISLPFNIFNSQISVQEQLNAVKEYIQYEDNSNKIDEKKEDKNIPKQSVFKCNFSNCNKSYRSKENLTIHIQNKHIGIKPFKCSFCSSMFSQRNGNIFLL